MTDSTPSSDASPSSPPVVDSAITGNGEQNADDHTPFKDLDEYLRIPRVGSLAVARDGSRVILTVSEVDEKAVKFESALWELDPTGKHEARRITFSERGESAPLIEPDGSVLFLSSRGSGEGGEDPPASVWRLPAAGGEASEIVTFPGGVSALHQATHAAVTLVTAGMLSGANTREEDKERRALRTDRKVTAIMHTSYPVRYWDHDLGPQAPRLWLLGDSEPQDLTPPPVGSQVIGGGVRESSLDIASDGSFLVTSFSVPSGGGAVREVLVKVAIATGESTLLLDEIDANLYSPKISPDHTHVAYERESISTPTQAPRITLHLLSLTEGTSRPLAPDWDRWPTEIAWSPEGDSLYVIADDQGRAPIFHLKLSQGQPEPITRDDFAYHSISPTTEGSVFALRSSYARPTHPVRIDPDGSVRELLSPGSAPALPGTLEEISVVVETGETVRSWLALPREASSQHRVPLALWVHGGPLSSWNSWSWRWNPWLLAAQGYAVLLPDPALSTGYGQAFVQRGWGQWGGTPYTDLMKAVDGAVEHPAIDSTRIAAMGGSFGGYMANWIAGHTDRFAAIVTHASIWALDQFGPTTDATWYWEREMTAEMAKENSPHLHVENIGTPMLVIHGDRDYRVPIGEGVRLWWELLSRSQLPADDNGITAHRFLYFPHENHWILQPQHSKLWYQVVLSFLAEHVRGEIHELPAVLGL